MATNLNIENIRSTFEALLEDKKSIVSRPGVYYGVHFYDLDGYLLWATGNENSCGTDKWFNELKKDGDTYEMLDICGNTGMHEYRIILVA